MEHFSLSSIEIGYEEIEISRARSDDMLINTNQLSSSIDRRNQSEKDFSFMSWNSCN